MVHDTTDRLHDASAFEGFERMEDKVRQKEAMAAASAELERDPLEDKFAELEKTDDLDRQLTELKDKVKGGGGGPPAAA